MIVVHPTDPSTKMLESVYEGLPNVTLFDSYDQRDEVLAALKAAPKEEPVFLLGHGAPYGLIDMRAGFIIDDEAAEYLKDRSNLICIWCHASSYAEYHGLKGFFSGMFISEDKEARIFGVDTPIGAPERCATDFAKRLGDLLREGKSIKEAAEELMDPKWIVDNLTEYNYKRLQYRENGDEEVLYP